MRLLSRLAAACFVLALPVLLVTTNLRLLISDTAFYKRGFREYDAPQATGIALPALDRAADEIAAYFHNDAATLRIVVEEDGEEVSLFNPRETEHMQDVKRLVRIVFRANEVSLAFVITYVAGAVLWSGERSVRGLASLSLAAGIGALSMTSGFDSTWNRFHELVFTNDFWQLNPDTDHLIQMFPEAFWEEAVYILGVMTLAEVAVIVVASALYLLRSRERHARRAAPPVAIVQDAGST
jgi:integral membrane protein (TIGR01906 family)